MYLRRLKHDDRLHIVQRGGIEELLRTLKLISFHRREGIAAQHTHTQAIIMP